MKYEECNCMCHSNNMIIHCMPCCVKCEYCEKNIVLSQYNEHKKECKEKNLTEEGKNEKDFSGIFNINKFFNSK